MRLLHIKDNNINTYIVIDKIIGFDIFYSKDLKGYTAHIKTNTNITPLTYKTNKPEKVIKDLLTIINTIDNEIIEYTIKEEE